MTSAMDLLRGTRMPPRIAALPRDRSGYPVPRFVMWFDGAPDFRVADAPFMAEAVRKRLCWICGGELGRMMTFVVGPMCTVNRVSSEPPSHLFCAQYAAQVCPFLAIPLAHRTETKHPHNDAAGIMLEHNPGVAALWVTRDYKTFRPPVNGSAAGVLFDIGEPAAPVLWYAEGVPATHDQVVAAMRRGIGALIGLAKQEGAEAVAALRTAVRVAAHWTPGGQLPADLVP